METSLPSSIIAGAQLAGNEYGWPVAAFPDATRAAQKLSYACLGGQFQFRAGGSVREMYWLNADAAERGPHESWSAYVTRSCEEVRNRFERLTHDTNFQVEAEKWSGLLEDIGPGKSPSDFLVFVSYFVSEAEHERLRAATHGA